MHLKLPFITLQSHRLKTKGFMHIKDVPCLIIWGNKDMAMPSKYYQRFRQKLSNAKLEEIRDSGHSLVDEKTALVYDKIRIFLS
jgi:pimeloyl-ACP methyl ester carboxylesterase